VVSGRNGETVISDAEFARRLRMVRAYLDLTLDDVGKRLGLAASTVSKRERADQNGATIRQENRFFMASVYCELSGWPMEFFTAEEIPPLPSFGSDEDDLSPAEVVELVEGREGDDGAEAGRG